MAPSETSNRTTQTRRWTRGSNLLLLAGIPLVILHAGLLLERAMHRETLDAVVIARWGLAAALLVVLGRLASRIRTIQSPALGVAAILIFALIHAPVAAPEPGLPLAATALGLALSLLAFEELYGAVGTDDQTGSPAGPKRSSLCCAGSCETLKDRAPPVAR
jgi:hypothetical protein